MRQRQVVASCLWMSIGSTMPGITTDSQNNLPVPKAKPNTVKPVATTTSEPPVNNDQSDPQAILTNANFIGGKS